MKNNFDLRKFLTENKLTTNSKMVKERADFYDNAFEALMDAVDDVVGVDSPDHDKLAAAVEDALNSGDIDASEFSHSVSAPRRAVEAIADKLGIGDGHSPSQSDTPFFK